MTSTVASGTPLSGTVAPWARPAEPRLSVPLHASGTPPLPETLSCAVAVELTPTSAAARLANREVWRLALGGLPFRAGESCANQPPVNRAVVLPLIGGVNGQVVGTSSLRRGIERFFSRHLNVGKIVDRLRRFRERLGTERAFHRFTGRGFGAFPAWWRNLCPFEFVVRVTGGASCLLDLILNHGHHGMTGDAALAGTIVVQDVTEPKPALLH
jgi:hypothetical protein